MSDTLIGVIIGGMIASITPLVMLILDHRRWQRESKLEHLKSDRKRLEKVFKKNEMGTVLFLCVCNLQQA